MVGVAGRAVGCDGRAVTPLACITALFPVVRGPKCQHISRARPMTAWLGKSLGSTAVL